VNRENFTSRGLKHLLLTNNC